MHIAIVTTNYVQLSENGTPRHLCLNSVDYIHSEFPWYAKPHHCIEPLSYLKARELSIEQEHHHQKLNISSKFRSKIHIGKIHAR